MKRRIFTDLHDEFRRSFRSFIEREMAPHAKRWSAEGIMDRQVFERAGATGFLGTDAPEQHGGGGVSDFRFNVVMNEELQYADLSGVGLGLTLHNDICMPYFVQHTNDEQRARWLPGITAGESITAIAMTEPSTGSDLASISTTAIADGDEYVVTGSKTFITNGINADLVIVAAKTDPTQRQNGISLIVVDADAPGFERGRNLEKIGMHGQDTAELFFDDVRVPMSNRIGAEGGGFSLLMENLAQERLSIAVAAVAASEYALHVTLKYVTERSAFGKPLARMQSIRLDLAELHIAVQASRAFIDSSIVALGDDELSAADAAGAKFNATETLGQVVDRCVQMHGGYGYMSEYPIARAYLDARVTRIYGGASEVMKEIVGRDLVNRRLV